MDFGDALIALEVTWGVSLVTSLSPISGLAMAALRSANKEMEWAGELREDS
jgi:hypothetical protein